MEGVIVLLAALAIDLAAPARYESWSVDGRHVAVSDPASYSTSVYRVDGATRTLRWSMSGWHRALHLANDGDHVAIPADDLGFVRADYDPSVEVLRVVRCGRTVRTVTLRDVVRQRREDREPRLWRELLPLRRSGPAVPNQRGSREKVRVRLRPSRPRDGEEEHHGLLHNGGHVLLRRI